MIHHLWVKPVVLRTDRLEEVEAPQPVRAVAEEGLNVHVRQSSKGSSEVVPGAEPGYP